MAPPNGRGHKPSFSQSKSTPNFASLDAFRNDRAFAPDEPTPRVVNGNFSMASSTTGPETTSDASEDDDDADFQSHYSFDAHSSSASASSHSGSDEPAELPRPLLSRSQSAYLGAHTFAPPFYNRPPTPLPPSPSLTSLLRPSFSATTSRPTTPDSSENDTPNDTEAAVAKSARTATTVPRASPKVPTYEYYGFVLYLMSSLCFLIYLLWAYLPSPFLHQLGIYYYPNRWWALAIPSFPVMCIVYIYVALASYNTEYMTLPMDSIENIVDEAANVAVLDGNGRIIRRGKRGETQRGIGAFGDNGVAGDWNWAAPWSEGTDAVMDVPVGGVCEILYGSGGETWSGLKS